MFDFLGFLLIIVFGAAFVWIFSNHLTSWPRLIVDPLWEDPFIIGFIDDIPRPISLREILGRDVPDVEVLLIPVYPLRPWFLFKKFVLIPSMLWRDMFLEDPVRWTIYGVEVSLERFLQILDIPVTYLLEAPEKAIKKIKRKYRFIVPYPPEVECSEELYLRLKGGKNE